MTAVRDASTAAEPENPQAFPKLATALLVLLVMAGFVPEEQWTELPCGFVIRLAFLLAIGLWMTFPLT